MEMEDGPFPIHSRSLGHGKNTISWGNQRALPASILPVSPENGWKRLKDEWKETEDTVFLSYLMCPLLPSHLSSISFFHPNSRTERQRETKLCALQGAGMLFPWPRK